MSSTFAVLEAGPRLLASLTLISREFFSDLRCLLLPWFVAFLARMIPAPFSSTPPSTSFSQALRALVFQVAGIPSLPSHVTVHHCHGPRPLVLVERVPSLVTSSEALYSRPKSSGNQSSGCDWKYPY